MTIKETYVKWLSDNIIETSSDDDTTVLSIPYLNSDEEYTEILVAKNDDGSYVVTDSGLTATHKSSGSFSDKEHEFIARCGISEDNESNLLYVESPKDSLMLNICRLTTCAVGLREF